MNRETLELINRETHRIQASFKTIVRLIEDEMERLRRQEQEQQAKAS